jgi:hypothetical protein
LAALIPIGSHERRISRAFITGRTPEGQSVFGICERVYPAYSFVLQPTLDLFHERTRNSTLSVLRGNREPVKVRTPKVPATQNTPDDPTRALCDQKQVAVLPYQFLKELAGVRDRSTGTNELPELKNGRTLFSARFP